MKHQAPVRFVDAVADIHGAVVLLDVDGTLLADGADGIALDVKEAVRVLANINGVYLLSNGESLERMERFSSELGVPIAPAGVPAGKPSARAADGIQTNGRSVVVMGDKYMTDGLLAKNLGARFVPISRIRSGSERLPIKLSYMLDRVVSWFL